LEIKAIRGMNDILPEDIYKWRFTEETARRIFGLYGFNELRTPILERTDLFFRGIGDDTDVVEKQMYTFNDKSGSSIALRPEATASVLRAVIEKGLLNKDPIQKIFSIGPMFRYERPQKGRYRQFHQINIERLGEEDSSCDAETLCMAYDLANALGLKGVTMEVNSLGCNTCRDNYKKALKTYLSSKKDHLCSDCSRRLETNPLRLLDCKVVSCREAVKDSPAIFEFLCNDCKEHYQGLLAALGSFNVPYVENPRLVRGLDYYTRTTFEITAEGLGSQNAIAGGGRYDNLVQILGGPDASGIGFAFGLERVIMLMDREPLLEPGCFVISHGGPEVKNGSLQLLGVLRNRDIKSEAVFDKSFKSQMRRAGKSGYRVCAIIGEDEIARSLITIKDLDTSEQIQVDKDKAVDTIISMFDKQGEKT